MLGPIISEQRVTFYPAKERPESLVAELNATEDACGWTYKLAHNEQRNAWFIQIFDEDAEYVGTL